MNELNAQESRRMYEKPQLGKVRLVPEEAVLAVCKANDGLINAWVGEFCGRFFQCFDMGS
ncbi:MAG: hypothetical protein IAE80_07835 [Anaerolinea sp.]|nr:hypothetical protein [Anaerolinea sp.]